MNLFSQYILLSSLILISVTHMLGVSLNNKNIILSSGTYHLKTGNSCMWKLNIKNNIINKRGSKSEAFIGIPSIEPKGKISAMLQYPGNGLILLGVKNKTGIQVFILKLNGKEKLPLKILNLESKDKSQSIKAFRNEKECLN